MRSHCFWYVVYTSGKNVVFAFSEPKTQKEFDEYIKLHYDISLIKEYTPWNHE